MSDAITIDRSGRLVLPKAYRQQLHLEAGGRLRVELVAGRIELTPIDDQPAPVLKQSSGIKVIPASAADPDAPPDAAAAMAAERDAQAGRAGPR